MFSYVVICNYIHVCVVVAAHSLVALAIFQINAEITLFSLSSRFSYRIFKGERKKEKRKRMRVRVRVRARVRSLAAVTQFRRKLVNVIYTRN